MNLRIPYNQCKEMTLKQIRNTPQYKKLSPLGKINKSGTYHYGNKSSANKEELCKIMDNPVKYQQRMIQNKSLKKNSSKRKRATRKGECLYPVARKPVAGKCKTNKFPYLGLTTEAKKCCYKRKQSEKTMKKRSLKTK